VSLPRTAPLLSEILSHYVVHMQHLRMPLPRYSLDCTVLELFPAYLSGIPVLCSAWPVYEGKIYDKLNLEYLKARLAKKE